MAITLATQTVAAIDGMIKADQGIEFRRWLGRVIAHVGDAYRTEPDSHRSHMGASLIAGECGRAIWYNFRWATKPNFEGRMIRLFNRGHLEEARFIAMLLMIGCQIYQQDENGKQFRIHHAEGHFGGSGDGIAMGIPDLPQGQVCLTEFKTHNAKSFGELKSKGVREAKFEHFGQMNTYMEKMGIPVCLYLAVNKDNDELYGEIVYLDRVLAGELLDRGERLVWMEEPPPKIARTPGFWKCRFCDHSPVCHNNALPDINCRTCEFSRPAKNAEWECLAGDSVVVIDKERQLIGCQHWKRKEKF